MSHQSGYGMSMEMHKEAPIDSDPNKETYEDTNDLIDEYCERANCEQCHGTERNGEPNGYGCEAMEQWVAKHTDRIVLDDGAMITVNGKGDLAICPDSRKFIGVQCTIKRMLKSGKYLVLHPDGSEAAIAKRNFVKQ